MQFEEIKEMLLRRLESMSPDEGAVINTRSYLRAELIKHVEKEDLVGQKMVAREAQILQTLQANGVWR